MTQYITFDSIIICLLLTALFTLNKRFLRNILVIFEVIIIFGGYYYFLSHYKDITILNMIVAYNPVETVLGLVIKLNFKPSGALSQFSSFTFNEIVRIVVLTIKTRLISPVTSYVYRIRKAFIKALSEIGFNNIEDTYYSLCA